MKVREIIAGLLENYGWEDEIKVKEIYCFKNNNVAVLDGNGHQIPVLQGLIKTNMVKIQSENE